MKNFFKNIFKKRKKPAPPKSIRFNAISVNNLPPTSKGTSLASNSIKKLKPKTLSYIASRSLSYGGEFLPPEYDLAEVGVVEDVESIVRQANRKKIALMYKEGYDFVGKNLVNVQYTKERLHQISIATDIPTAELLRSIGTSLVRLSNAFLLKVRDTKSSGGSVRITPEGKKLNPVAGYFPIPAETMRMKVNQTTGAILKWRQEMPDGRYIDYNPEDIVHFYIHRKDGFIFGTPDLVPVIDDIRALRKIEENIELLIYQNLFPLFHYTVGTETAPAGYTEDGTKEIDAVKEEIQYMPSEGGIVTPERHKIELIGSEGRALRAEGYVNHFKMRVIAGLGISEMDLGVGNTANRGTARTLSRQLIDTVKAIQDTLESQFNQQVINELLLESTLAKSTDILDQKNLVGLQFREIDLENKMEIEKHAIELFQSNGITYPEFRMELGKEPIEVPDDLKKNNPTKYPDWHQTFWKLFSEPEQIIRSIDEGWIKTGASSEDKPKPVAVRNNTKQKINDAIILDNPYRNLESEIISTIVSSSDTGQLNQQIESIINNWKLETISNFSSFAVTEFIQGFDDETFNQSPNNITYISKGRSEIVDRCSFYINKLSNNIYSSINNLLTNNTFDKVTLVNSIRSIFSLEKYRVEFISDVETRKAYYYGTILGMKSKGIEKLVFLTIDESCDRCNALNGKEFNVDDLSLSNCIPIHPNCNCVIQKK